MSQIITVEEAVAKVKDGMTVMVGGFLANGSPNKVLDALAKSGVKDLTVICNDSAYPDKGIGQLIVNKQLKKLIVSYIGACPQTAEQMNSGELEVEFSPQGTLAERVRAGGFGLGGVLTPTGLGTVVAEGKQVINIDGKDFLLDGAKGVASIPLHTTFAGSLVIVVTFLTATALLMNSKHGRSMLAVREDDLAAQMSGINTFRSKMLAMCMSALYAGIAGGMMAHYFGYLQPKMFMMVKSTEYTIMVIFGGMGSITGSVLGTVLLCALPELLRAVGDWRLVMYGLAVIIIMIVRPKGLMGGKEFPIGRICRAIGRIFTGKKKDGGNGSGEEALV